MKTYLKILWSAKIAYLKIFLFFFVMSLILGTHTEFLLLVLKVATFSLILYALAVWRKILESKNK